MPHADRELSDPDRLQRSLYSARAASFILNVSPPHEEDLDDLPLDPDFSIFEEEDVAGSGGTDSSLRVIADRARLGRVLRVQH
jgi:hypothetical protein